MAMRGDLPAIFGPNAGMNKPNAGMNKPNAGMNKTARKANTVQTKMNLPPPLAPAKPLAPKVSTKPSDTPMGQASMGLNRPTAPLPPLPKLPSLNPKPAGAMPRDPRSRRPRTGLK